jgi:excisionase family DNA binding protein
MKSIQNLIYRDNSCYMKRMPEDDSKTSNSEQPKLDELISIRAASDLSGLSQSYIRRLVSQGEIWGMKLGRNWVTTEQAIKEYLVRDRKPGPKPKQNS